MRSSGGALSRLVRAVSVPLLFAEVSEIVVHVTDTVFLARVGTVEVGAIALADSLLEVAVVLTVGLIEGIQILFARRVGEGRDRAAGDVFNLGLLLLTLVSLALTALLLVAARPVTALLVTSPDVGAAVVAFLRVIAFGIVFNSANYAYSALLVGLGTTRPLIGATLVLLVTNVALDYLLVFGKLGLPALGIRGSALGSVGAEIAAFLYLTRSVLRRADPGRYGLFRFARWKPRLVRSLAMLSSPVALHALVEAGRWFAFFLILERMGPQALAASNVVYSCYAVLQIPTQAFGEAACSLVSRLIGRGQERRIGLLMREVLSPAYGLTLPFAGLALLCPGLILSWVASDPALVAAGRASLRVVAAAMLVVIPGELWLVAVSGTGDTSAALGIEVLLTLTMVAASLTAAWGMGLGAAFVWMSLPAGWVLALAASYVWVRAGYWKRLEI